MFDIMPTGEEPFETCLKGAIEMLENIGIKYFPMENIIAFHSLLPKRLVLLFLRIQNLTCFYCMKLDIYIRTMK